jgi:hypothetical protein
VKVRKVIQRDNDNNIINVYDSLREAGKLNSVSSDTIRRYCQSGKIYKNFYWEYPFVLGFSVSSRAIPPPEGYVYELAEDED